MCVLPYTFPYTHGCDLSRTCYTPIVMIGHYCRLMVGQPWVYGNILKMLLKLTELCDTMERRTAARPRLQITGRRSLSASGSHLDLIRAPHCYVLYGVKYINLAPLATVFGNFMAHLDLNRALYLLYGVKHIDPVPPRFPVSACYLDLSRAPYLLYGVKYIDPESLVLFSGKRSALSKLVRQSQIEIFTSPPSSSK